MADPNAALQPDFNPAKLTIPALRGVLLEFAPETLSSLASAKKADLVRAYNVHVLPQAPRLLAERLAVRADGTAIQRVHNARTSSDGAVPLPTTTATRKRPAPPAKATTARAKRASSRQPSVAESEDGAGASTSKRTRRAPAKRDLSESDTDEAPAEPKRRTKAARREPSVVEEPVEVRIVASSVV